MEYKICNVCGKKLLNNLENFYFAVSNKDGLTKQCKTCILKRQKRYKKKNRDKVLEWQRKYRENHKGKVIESNLKYRAKNKLKIKEANHKYHQTHKAKALSVINWHKKIARLNGARADFTIEQWINCKEYFNGSCAYCGTKTSKLQQDHVIPKSKGGEYTASNIICVCSKCNGNKKDKVFKEWYREQPFYSEDREKLIIDYLENVGFKPSAKDLNPNKINRYFHSNTEWSKNQMEVLK